MFVTNSTPFESQIDNFDPNQFIIDSSNQIIEMRRGGRFNQSIILKYEDNNEWVFLNNRVKERFCGFLYLQNAIKELNLKNIQAAENKIAIHDKKIIYLSKYYGDSKPDIFELWDYNHELSILKEKIGFIDMVANANLRKENNTVYVFDTEINSFDKTVHEKIESYFSQHDIILSFVEKSLNKEIS